MSGELSALAPSRFILCSILCGLVAATDCLAGSRAIPHPSCLEFSRPAREYGYAQERLKNRLPAAAPAANKINPPPAGLFESEIIRGFSDSLVQLPGSTLGIIRTDPRPEPALASWLTCHDRVAETIRWPEKGSLRPYAAWSGEMKQQLQDEFTAAWARYEFRIVTDGTAATAAARNEDMIPRKEAWALYLQSVAQNLAAELGGWYPWSLEDLDEESLVLLLGGDSLFRRAGGRSGDEFYSPNTLISGDGVPQPANEALSFLIQNQLLGADRRLTIAAALEWMRANPAGTPDRCQKSAGMLIGLLRAAGIPARKIQTCGHALAAFPSEGLFLSHMDDPYDPILHGMTRVHGGQLLIGQNTFEAWFSGSPEKTCLNVGRKPPMLALVHLSRPLLHAHCKDRQDQRPRKESRVRDMYRRYLSMGELEGSGLWRRLDRAPASDCGR